jgi:hypothetical protein
MATMTKNKVLTLRLSATEKAGLTLAAQMRAEKPGSLAVRLIAEGVRRARFAGLDFRPAGARSVAYLAGSRWPAWMILDLVEELNGDVEAAALQVKKPPALIRLVLRYAEAYPEEMRLERELVAQRGDFRGLNQVRPGLETS